MPALIKRLTPTGLQDVDYSADSLALAARHEPDDGIYTVTNTYNTYQTLKLDAHFDRMEDSAQRAGIALDLDRQRVRDSLRQMIDMAQYGDVRFRITVPRQQPDHLILTLEPFTPPAPELIAQGVRCITALDSARDNAEAKTTDWMHRRKTFADAMPDHIYDTFLLDSAGYLLEGLSANVYVIQDGTLYTADAGVLKGISRQIVLSVAPPIVPVVLQAPHIDQLPDFDEAFLTSSSRGIIPVVEIDGVAIGTGRVGATTRALRGAYRAWLADHLQAL
jgi:branched-chain amino acid aminotransferase